MLILPILLISHDMQKAILVVFILLLVVLGLLFYIRDDENVVNVQDVEGIVGEKLKITFLDVGQGDATFIEFTDGQKMLVDCAIDGRVIEALGRVMEYWDHEIDYLLITHPDLDHYGGCEEILNRFQVKNIIYNGLIKDYDEMWNSFWQAVQDENVNYFEIDREDVWEISSTTLHFLYPDHSIADDKNIPGEEKEANGNNTSIIFELEHEGHEILMMADAEAELEEYLLGIYGEQLDTDLLKAGHHGSGGSSIQDFVDTATPNETIISCGLGNNFGHPSRRILKRLERVSSTVWRTDLQGDIVVGVGEELQVEIN